MESVNSVPTSFPIVRVRANSFDAAQSGIGLASVTFDSVPEARPAIRDVFAAMQDMPLLRADRWDQQDLAASLPAPDRADVIARTIAHRRDTTHVVGPPLNILEKQYRMAAIVGNEFDFQFILKEQVGADSYQHCYLFLDQIQRKYPLLRAHFSQALFISESAAGLRLGAPFIVFDNLHSRDRHGATDVVDALTPSVQTHDSFVDYLSHRRNQLAFITPSGSTKIHTFSQASTRDDLERALDYAKVSTNAGERAPTHVALLPSHPATKATRRSAASIPNTTPHPDASPSASRNVWI